MVIGRMINKNTNTETLLVDKNDVMELKSEVIALKRKLMGADAFIKASEVDLARLQQRLNEYEGNIGCKIVLQITKLIKKAFQFLRNKLRKDYTFMNEVQDVH